MTVGPNAGLSPEGETAASAFGRFAWEMSRVVAADSENFLISPQIVASVLARLLLGAVGETARELAGCVGFPSGREAVGSAGQLDRLIMRRSAGCGLSFAVANALWVQSGLALEPEFLRVLREDDVIEAVDFAKDPEAARATINAWAKERTHGRIPEILPIRDIDRATALVLASASHLKAGWAFEFDAEDTRPHSFRRPDGSDVAVPMMWGTQPRIGYASGEGFRAAALPLGVNGGLVMLTILPAEDSPAIDVLSSRFFREVLQSLVPARVPVGLPRFTVASTVDLKPVLTELGVRRAFTPNAEFSRIGPTGLFVSHARHQGYVRVDEQGLEASAAAAVVLKVSKPREVPELVFDRPFWLVVCDAASRVILFVGRVNDPSAAVD